MSLTMTALLKYPSSLCRRQERKQNLSPAPIRNNFGQRLLRNIGRYGRRTRSINANRDGKFADGVGRDNLDALTRLGFDTLALLRLLHHLAVFMQIIQDG